MNSNRELELGVCGLHLISSDALEVVVGIRNCDVPLPIGHVFTEALVYDFDRYKRERAIVPDESLTLHVLKRTSVQFRVTRIHWYGRDIQTLDPGHTAALTLEGADMNALEEQCSLR